MYRQEWKKALIKCIWQRPIIKDTSNNIKSNKKLKWQKRFNAMNDCIKTLQSMWQSTGKSYSGSNHLLTRIWCSEHRTIDWKGCGTSKCPHNAGRKKWGSFNCLYGTGHTFYRVTYNFFWWFRIKSATNVYQFYLWLPQAGKISYVHPWREGNEKIGLDVVTQ